MRHSTIRKLANQKHVQSGMFDTYGMASIPSSDFPGERLIVCFSRWSRPSDAASAKRCRRAPSRTPCSWRGAWTAYGGRWAGSCPCRACRL